MRLGLHEHDLSFRFGVSTAVVRRVCKTWVAHARLPPSLPSSRPWCFAFAVPERRPVPDSGTALTSVSPDSATIFVCPPINLASTETLVRQDVHDSNHEAADPLVVEGILRKVGVQERVARRLSWLGGGGAPKSGDIASFCVEVGCGVPRIKNWHLFDRPLPASLLPLGSREAGRSVWC